MNKRANLCDSALVTWLADSDEALEILRETVGDDGAEQIREETRDAPWYDGGG